MKRSPPTVVEMVNNFGKRILRDLSLCSEPNKINEKRL
jgi:hypothetical protein